MLCVATPSKAEPQGSVVSTPLWFLGHIGSCVSLTIDSYVLSHHLFTIAISARSETAPAESRSVIIYLAREFSQQNVIRCRANIVPYCYRLAPRATRWKMARGAKLTPFSLNPEKNPHPSANNFQQLHQENAPFQIVEMVQMG